MVTKEFWKSKTFWLAFAYGVGQIILLLIGSDYQPDAQTQEIVAIVLAVLVIILRSVTKQPLGLRKEIVK